MTPKQIVRQSFPESILRKIKSSGWLGRDYYYVLIHSRFPTIVGAPALTPHKAWTFAVNELQLMMLEKLEA